MFLYSNPNVTKPVKLQRLIDGTPGEYVTITDFLDDLKTTIAFNKVIALGITFKYRFHDTDIGGSFELPFYGRFTEDAITEVKGRLHIFLEAPYTQTFDMLTGAPTNLYIKSPCESCSLATFVCIKACYVSIVFVSE
jgi:hypothetical protein